MAKEVKRYSPEKKAAILTEIISNNAKVSEVCDRFGVTPTSIATWQKELLENAVEVFRKSSSVEREKDKKISQYEETLVKRDRLITELVTENVELKKNFIGAN